jgi:hypothetical protein
LHVCHRVKGTAKMTTVMDQRIRCTAEYRPVRDDKDNEAAQNLRSLPSANLKSAFPTASACYRRWDILASHRRKIGEQLGGLTCTTRTIYLKATSGSHAPKDSPTGCPESRSSAGFCGELAKRVLISIKVGRESERNRQPDKSHGLSQSHSPIPVSHSHLAARRPSVQQKQK